MKFVIFFFIVSDKFQRGIRQRFVLYPTKKMCLKTPKWQNVYNLCECLNEGGGEGEIPSASAIGLPIKKKQNTQNKTCIIFALRVSRSLENKYLSCISLQLPFSSCSTILQFQLWFQIVCSPCN